jgi:hypothetical protein
LALPPTWRGQAVAGVEPGLAGAVGAGVALGLGRGVAVAVGDAARVGVGDRETDGRGVVTLGDGWASGCGPQALKATIVSASASPP